MCALLLLLSCVLPRAATAADAAGSDFRAEVSEVQLEMVATDAVGRPIPNLTATDLKVLEDGSPVHNFGLNSTRDVPLLATLIYDTSESNQKSWRKMQEPVIHFARSTIGKQDHLWIAAFDSKLQFNREIQTPEQIPAALNARRGTFNATAFNDALVQALRDFPSPSMAPRRGAMIVFSDGEDNYSIHSFEDVVSAAQRAKVSVYTVHRATNLKWQDGELILHTIAVRTGGRDFSFHNLHELEADLNTIAEELRSGYVLYYPARPSRMGNELRSINVHPSHASNMRIQVQNAYYVPSTEP